MAKSYEQVIRERLEKERREREEKQRQEMLQKNSAANAYGKMVYERALQNSQSKEENVGGFWGGVGYLGQSFLNGAVRGVEGVVDYTVGGIASIFGADEYAEKLMTEDWYNYNAAAEKYNPGSVMGTVGDVFGGVGQGALSIGVGALASWLSQGTLAPAAIAAIGAGFSGVSAAGTAVSEAAKDPNADKAGLDYTDWLYGTGVGALEAGIEYGTGKIGNVAGNVFGKTSGEIGSELFEAITKKGVSNTVTSSVGKEILQEMAGEGLEEGLSTFLEPYIKQATYDKDAESASFGDITYSALVGALAGGATIGPIKGIETGISIKRGADIAKDQKKTADLFKNAEIISSYERERQTGSEVFEAVSAQYEKVKKSLESTGGVAKTATQQAMLGELDRYVAAAAMQPALVSAARGVALNAEAYAESLNAFYAKTNAGKTVTAADLTAGLKLDGSAKQFVKSVNKAMRTNSVLREVVVNNTLGRMELDAAAYADSIYGDTRISAIATQENINRFVENADPETIESLGRALGIDMRTATSETLAAAIKQFRDSGNAALYEEGYNDIRAARGTEKYTEGLPSANNISEGVTRYKSGDTDIAIIKRGDTYRIYDYGSKKITRVLSRSELLTVLRELRGEGASALEVVGRLLDTSSVGDADTFPSSGRLETAEIKRLAEEKIPEYKGLVETEREAVRETLRRALANGVSEEDAVLFGRIAAKSGMHIVVNTSGRDVEAPSPTTETTNDAWYDGKNTVYVNAEADRSRTFSGLLGHEMWHRMFKAKKAKKLFMKAYGNMPEGERQEIIDQYKDDSKKNGLSVSDSVNIAKDEVAAAYAEEIFNSPDVWEFVLSEEPSLKDRVLKFFRGANKKYSFEPGMTKAAKKWLNEYKKLFNEVAANNKGRSAAENAVASDKVRKIERLGRIVESAEGDDGSRKAIAILDNGNTYVVATRKVITGETKAEQRKQISSFFNVLLDNKQSLDIHTLEGDVLTITKAETAKKARDDYKTVDGKHVPMSDDEFRVKLNAEAHIDELAEISKPKKPKLADTKTHTFAKDGFTYRTAYFEDFDGKYYKITLSIGHNGSVATVYNVGEIKENVPSSAKIIAVTSSKALDETFSNSSIPDSAKKSNSFDKNSSKKVDDGSSSSTAAGGPPSPILGKAEVDDGSRSALKKSDKEYRDKVKAKADERVRKEKEKAKAYAKEKIAEAKEAFDDKVTSLEGRAQDAERKAEAAAKKYGYEERAALVKVLMPEAKTEEEKRSLFRYMEQLRIMSDTLGERAVLVQEHEDARAKLKKAETSAEKSKIREAIASLEERIELIENVISRRDSELFEIGAMQPLRELVQRAYKLGKSDGANSRVTTGVIKKRLAELFHSKSFSHSEAKATIKQIANRFKIEDFSVKSQWASHLWEQLNDTDNRTSQKKAINALADEITRYLHRKETKGMSAQAALVRRVQKYKHRLVFSEAERQNLKKYYTSEYDNIMSVWEYDGDKNVVPKHVSDILWDAGQVREYSEFAEFENASPSFKSDKFYDLLSEFETHEERVTEISDSAKSAKQEILDILWEGFENGGRETYKAKYDYEVKNRKLYRTLERRVAAFADLEKGRFKNATEGGGLLFVNTLDQIPKMLYKGSFYPQRAKKVLVDLNKWYTTDNNMLGYVSEENPGLFDKDIKNVLEFLPKGDNNVKFTYEQLEMLDQVLQYFYNFVEHYNKIYRKGKWEDALPVAEQMLSVAQKQESSNKMPLEKIYRSRYVKGFGDTESVMKICDSYEDGIFTDTFYELREGYIDAQVLEMELKSEFDAFIANKKNKKFFDSLYEKTAEVNGVKIPRYALIGYYLSLQREHSRAGLAYNGFFVPSADNKKLIQVPGFATMDYVYDEQKTQEENRLAEQSMINRFANEELFNLNKILTSQEKEYISIIEKTFASCKVIKEEADVNMYGYSNCVDGYYYPTRRYATGIGATLDVYAEMSGVDRFTNASFNKNTVKGAKQALYIEDPAVVLSRHVKNLTLYAKVSPAVENFNRLWNLDVANNKNLPMSLKTFYDQSERAWKIDGKVVGFEYLRGIIEDITNGGNKNIGFLDKFMSKIRGGYATFALGGVAAGNPKVLVTQLSSIISSAALLHNSSIVKSVNISGRDVDKYCPLAALRNKDDSAVRAQTVTDKISERQRKWTLGISGMDRLVIKRLFAACQVEAKTTKGLEIGTEANKIEAGKILHDVILGTQQNALITERTESMRSGSEFSKMLSMFRGDAIKNFGRLIDASGEILYLKAQLPSANGEARETIEKKLKVANLKFGKSLGSIMMNSAVLVGISRLFEFLLAKEDDDETPWYLEFLIDFGSNFLGGLPVISQVYSKLFEGHELEGFEYSMFNDLLNSLVNIFDLAGKLLEGKATWDDVTSNLEDICDVVGQFLGIPTRNIRNFLLGLTKRFFPEFGYRIEDLFGKKNYGADLEDALEAGDDDLVLTILELAMKEKLGSGLSDGAIRELARLAGLGESMLPSAVGDSVTIDGEERELSGSELKAVREIYGEAVERINVFVESAFYKSLNDKQKASAVRKIYTLYKDLGYDSVLGTERDKKAMMLSKLVSGDALVMWDACTVLESDKDEDGKTISGSKKEKVIKAIWSLDIPDVQKLLLIGMRGYKFDDDDIPGVSGYAAQMALYSYIESLEGLTDEERLDLFEASGFEIKGGVAQVPSSSSTKKAVKVGTMKGTMVGTMVGSMIGKDYSKKIIKLGRIVNK